MATKKDTSTHYVWVILIVGVLCVIAYNASYNKKMDEVNRAIRRHSFPGANPSVEQEMNRQWKMIQQMSPQATPQQEQAHRYLNSPCRGCNGSGAYRFVTGTGFLSVQQCPYCRGRGRGGI